jgi:hypothetical protein
MLLSPDLFQEKEAMTVAGLCGVWVTGPLQPHAEGFGERLTELGYTRLSAADQLRMGGNHYIIGDLKQVIDLRPVYHRKEQRIRAHVILCWLALLLARVAENAAGQTWPELRRQLDRIAVGTFAGPAGTFRQRTQISPGQAAILGTLGIDPPPKIYQLTPAATR